MTIAITGGTGFVGQAVLDEAAKRVLDVRALTRRERYARPGVEWVPGDLADREGLARLMRGVEAAIHIAGAVNAPDKAGFEEANVRGTLRVLEAAKKAGVPRLIFVSSLAAREPRLSLYGASKARAEKLVAASGLDWTIVRPPAVYGPRDREFLDLFKAARWGVVPMPKDGRSSYIHVTDLARLLLDLLPGGEDVTGAIFEPDDGRANGWPHREFGRAIGWAIGKRPFVPGLSKGVLQRVASIDGKVRGPKAKLTQDRVGYMTHPDWVSSPARAVPAGLWQPRIATREGLKATADWYRAENWL